MNRQPYCRPPKWWPPKISARWVAATRGYRRRQLVQAQQLVEIRSENLDVLRDAAASGNGVLIVPNHAVHYDGPALYVAVDEIHLPLYFMTAWQVFAMSSGWECWGMQRLGCFSVDRESADRNAFKQAVDILRYQPYPLVLFPEGDIYHTTDVVTPFREGAAAIALAAAKRAARPVVAVPCGIKFWYLEDPTPSLLASIRRIEERLYLRPAIHLSLAQRIRRLAETALALKELDYFGETSAGRLRDRIQTLLEGVLGQLEQRHEVTGSGTPPERVKAVRQQVIAKMQEASQETPELPPGDRSNDGEKRDSLTRLEQDMEDLFFVMQLFSYRGDYLAERPSIERIAETIDKFEEDILGLDYPTVHGRRRVSIRFGNPIEVGSFAGRNGVATLTQTLQQSVQALIDDLNTRSPALGSAGSMTGKGVADRGSSA